MVFNNERMVNIVASVRCWYKVGMRRRPHFHQLPTLAQRIFAIYRPGPFLGLTFWYFVMTPKDIHKIFIPQKIFIFLKTLKGIEIQNFEPQNGASLRMNENIIVPPPPSTLSSQIETGAGGRPDSNNRKKL